MACGIQPPRAEGAEAIPDLLDHEQNRCFKLSETVAAELRRRPPLKQWEATRVGILFDWGQITGEDHADLYDQAMALAMKMPRRRRAA